MICNLPQQSKLLHDPGKAHASPHALIIIDKRFLVESLLTLGTHSCSGSDGTTARVWDTIMMFAPESGRQVNAPKTTSADPLSKLILNLGLRYCKLANQVSFPSWLMALDECCHG